MGSHGETDGRRFLARCKDKTVPVTRLVFTCVLNLDLCLFWGRERQK